jgi:hypothetical protein
MLLMNVTILVTLYAGTHRTKKIDMVLISANL